MNIEQIPSDEVVVMTDFWHRAFNAAGCDPMCHCCEKMIPVDGKFKLATVNPLVWPVYEGYTHRNEVIEMKASSTARPMWEESTEVMLCDSCTPETFKEKELKEYHAEVKRINTPKGGCFRVKGKIIH